MKKILLIILGTLILSTMMFGVTVSPYQYSKNTWPKPDVYTFRGYCENQSSRTIELGAISDDRGHNNDGRVFVRPFSVAPKTTAYFPIEWHLMNNKLLDGNLFFFTIDHMNPKTIYTDECLVFNTGKDKRNKYLNFNAQTYQYQYFTLTLKEQGQGVYLTIKESSSIK